MENEAQAKFEGWAVVEMMGHQRVVGFVTTERTASVSDKGVIATANWKR